MPRKENRLQVAAMPIVADWLLVAMRSLGFAVITLATFFVQQLNGNISSLTAQLKVMEEHQVKSDERIAAIEVQRTMAIDQWKSGISDIETLKIRTNAITESLTTIREILNRKGIH